MAVPSVRGRLPRYRLDQAASRIVSQIQLARATAVSQNKDVFLSLDSTQRVVTVRMDRNGNGTFESDEQKVESLTEIPRLTMQTTSPGGMFRPRGTFTCPETYVRIGLSVESAGREFIYVLPSGHVERTTKEM
jgi:Tfp pilus assembly protein FimT